MFNTQTKALLFYSITIAAISLSTILTADINTTNSPLHLTRPITHESIKNLTETELITEIKYHDNLYWEKNQPDISDAEYDILVNRLAELAPDNPILSKKNSAKVASLGKVKLESPMLSLQKTYYFRNAPKGSKSLIDWLTEVKRNNNELFLIQPKYDGVSAYYSNNILTTRGDGNYGENITDKLPIIKFVTPSNKTTKQIKSLRGELVFRKDDFKKLQNKLLNSSGKKYKTPRNAVAGILNMKNITPLEKSGIKLTLIDFETYSYKVNYKNFKKKWPSILKKIESLPYPMDGIVVKLADKKYSESLGSTEHHPKGQIAFKFSNVRKQTKIIGIEWSFGKNSITPVAKLKPIKINNVTISRVSMHNIGTVEKNDWKIGDTLVIERAGDVIPHIVDSIPGQNRTPINLINCPSCGTELIRKNNALRCPNPECFETKLNKLEVSVKILGIRSLGKETLRKLMQHAKVKNLYDIYTLPEIKILELPGFGERSAKKLFNNIQNAKYIEDYQLLAALNIYGIGDATAKKILLNHTIEELKDMNISQLKSINGLGSQKAKNLYSKLHNPNNKLDNLLKILEVKSTKQHSRDQFFNAKSQSIHKELK